MIAGHPSVREVAVVPRADDTWGQVPIAAIAWHTAPVSNADLDAWCRNQLAGFKVPKDFVTVSQLPRNAMGKVDRRTLQRALA